MSKRKIEVEGLQITIETIAESDFVNLNDIAKGHSREPSDAIKSWLRNNSTMLFLEAWERIHNPLFNSGQMARIKLESMDNRNSITAQRYAEAGGIGLHARTGRYGGTWAHPDIALNFCYWLSPPFQVYFAKEFQRLKAEEARRHSLDWEAQRVKDLLDEARIWMDSILPPAPLPPLGKG